MSIEISPKSEIIPQKPVIVFCGDSITRGEYSYDWVPHIKTVFGDKINVSNEGYNSFTVKRYIKQKINNVLNKTPTDIIISLGTNDANAQWRHPEDPQWSVQNFEKNYHQLIRTIKEKSPNTKIAITTIPPIGEDFNHPIYSLVQFYNEVIKNIAQKEEIVLLPVFEMIQNEYKEDNRELKSKFSHTYVGEILSMANQIIKNKILKQDFQKISESAGYKKKIDELHLNKSAKVLAACASWFLKQNHPSLQTS
jgi:lysophospholipase L1-like esterase